MKQHMTLKQHKATSDFEATHAATHDFEATYNATQAATHADDHKHDTRIHGRPKRRVIYVKMRRRERGNVVVLSSKRLFLNQLWSI